MIGIREQLTSIVIMDLANGTEYVFIIWLGTDLGRGPGEEKTITTLTTGNDCKSINIYTYTL